MRNTICTENSEVLLINITLTSIAYRSSHKGYMAIINYAWTMTAKKGISFIHITVTGRLLTTALQKRPMNLYAVFKKLCMSMGIKYERAHPLPYMHDDVNNLSADSRKTAFEYSLYLLKRINPEWYERTIPEYERFLNLWRDKKNVYFDREIMQFKEK